tara:strand:+ start:652 stop:906 length:255 start_codon:yes stop_codon:yes gene_type:complete
MQKHHNSYEETKKIYGNTIALRINNDSLAFIERAILKRNIEQEKPRDFKFRINIYEKEKLVNVIRKLFFKNKLIDTSQKKYKLI